MKNVPGDNGFDFIDINGKIVRVFNTEISNQLELSQIWLTNLNTLCQL